MFYEDIFKKFNSDNIQYLVVGGIAVNLHGVPRTTQDLDLMINLEKNNIIKIIKNLTALGYKPKLPVNPEDLANDKKRQEWIDKKNLKAFTFYHEKYPALEVDLLVCYPISYEEAEKNKIIKKADDLIIPLISIKDLIKLKEPVNRKQDISDIAMLKKILEFKNE